MKGLLVFGGIVFCQITRLGSAVKLAGYELLHKDLKEHTEIDLDVQDTSDFTKSGNFPDGRSIYENGKYSDKGGGVLRTLQGFSTGIQAKYDTLQAADSKYLSEFGLFKSYYGNISDYANEYVLGAMEGSGDFDLSDAARNQLAVKGIQYQVVPMYALREFYESLANCEQKNEIDTVHWEEGVAFWIGSLVEERTDGFDGQLMYTLAAKRAGSFGTTDSQGVAKANNEFLKAAQAGMTAIQALDCASIEVQIKEIRKQMIIMLVQASLLYAKKIVDGTSSDDYDKYMAEGWAFSAAILPFIDAVNSTTASRIRKNLELKTGMNQTVEDGVDVVARDFYSILQPLCITCEEIGDVESVGLPACTTDLDVLLASDCPITLAGYELLHNFAKEHAEIDLDVEDISGLTSNANFSEGRSIYENGKYSDKGEGVLRTLQGFSTGIQAKYDTLQEANSNYLLEFGWFKSYYGNVSDYANQYVLGALEGSGDFDLSDVARRQLAVKGIQYQVVPMYALREFYESLLNCEQKNAIDTVHWEEGVAFWIGSLVRERTDGLKGQLMYTLADKRGGSFGTLDSEGVSASNNALLIAFRAGMTAIQALDCVGIDLQIKRIRRQMIITLIQATLQYAKKVVEATPQEGSTRRLQSGSADLDKYMAEGWAFVAGILPFIDNVNAETASRIRRNMELKTGVNQTVQDGLDVVAQDFYSVLEYMCIRCEDLGDLSGFPTCTTDNATLYETGCESILGVTLIDKEPTSGWIVFVVLFGILTCSMMVFTIWYTTREPSAVTAPADQGSKSNEAEESEEFLDDVKTLETSTSLNQV